MAVQRKIVEIEDRGRDERTGSCNGLARLECGHSREFTLTRDQVHNVAWNPKRLTHPLMMVCKECVEEKIETDPLQLIAAMTGG